MTITDANGCMKTVCVKVPAIGAVDYILTSPVYAGGNNIRCNGGNDGSINLVVISGGPVTSYLWNDGTTTEDRLGLSAGTYTVTVTNANCEITQQITLTEPMPLSVSTGSVDVTCFNGNNGAATVNVSGGNAPYSYQWNTVPVQTTATATGLTAGMYTVLVSDANGCTASAMVIISQPAAPISLSGVGTNVTCNGAADGTIDITVTGGTTTLRLPVERWFN